MCAAAPARTGWEMLQAADPERDQSYFLFATTREQLDFLRFPLGAMKKSQTRALAAQLGLPVASKPDSQDICFAPTGDYASVIREASSPESDEPGEIVHADGRVLGTHRGIVGFTVGQRKGLGIATGEPLFVLRIETHRRRVVVGPREMLRTASIRLKRRELDRRRNARGRARRAPRLFVKVRSTQAPRPAALLRTAAMRASNSMTAEYGVAGGQACVFYESGERLGPRSWRRLHCIGGGATCRDIVATPSTIAP